MGSAMVVWEPVSIQMKDGTRMSVPAQWRKKVPVYSIIIKEDNSAGKARTLRRNCPLDRIEWIQSGNHYYRTFQVNAGEEKVWCLGERFGNTNCYKVLFEERECLCNNSRRIVQAWIIYDPSHTGGNPVVLRKKRFANRFEDPVLARAVLGMDAMAELGPFSTMPATFFSDEP